jgi:glutathione reductase (NADPH)
MSEYDFDLFVIGAGSGGVRASRVAAAHGAKVAVAEEYRVGGTCVIRGCVPKKLLIYGAHFAEDLKDACRFGWNVPDCDFEWKTLRDNVLADVDRLEGLPFGADCRACLVRGFGLAVRLRRTAARRNDRNEQCAG